MKRTTFYKLVKKYESELVAKEKEINGVKVQLSQLQTKELDCKRYEEQSKRLEKEINTLHEKYQKQESKHTEEKLKLENRANFAEQSLEAYKKEIEESLNQKLRLEVEVKDVTAKMEVLQKTHDVRYRIGC